MKYSKSDVRSKDHIIPDMKFEEQSLTSFSGLVVFQQLCRRIGLKSRLTRCFQHLQQSRIFGQATVFRQLVIHILLGYRELRDSCYYRDDPLVKRLLGLKRLPDTATISRTLKDADIKSAENLRRLLRAMIFDRLRKLSLPRITLDFDGSVQSTGRFAEGTAVGYNKIKKGARSYYPLFCTIAQTGQVLDFLHRAGNVHDSRGARAFILACVQALREALPYAQIEVRMDSAFFSDQIIAALDEQGVEFSVTVPFERFVELKSMMETRKRWRRVDSEASYFESRWKPKKWDRRFRFVFVRSEVKRRQKGPVQLNLFIPYESGYDFKVVVTNKKLKAKALVAFHDGRGSQEGVFGELKSQCQMGYVPVRTLIGNQLYLLAGLFAHNLIRELQMAASPPSRTTTPKRAALWVFEKIDTFRKTLIQRAGRLTRPQGKLTLTISANETVASQILRLIDLLQPTVYTPRFMQRWGTAIATG